MGIEFRELAAFIRHRKISAFLLVAFTLAIGIIIGTLISGRALATRDYHAAIDTGPNTSRADTARKYLRNPYSGS